MFSLKNLRYTLAGFEPGSSEAVSTGPHRQGEKYS
jgi:hypothetical protein